MHHFGLGRLRSIARVRATRRPDAETTVQTRYYISSLPGHAAQILDATRTPWSVENDLRIIFRKDSPDMLTAALRRTEV